MKKSIKALVLTLFLVFISNTYAKDQADNLPVLPQALQDILLESAKGSTNVNDDLNLSDEDLLLVNTQLDDEKDKVYSSKISFEQLGFHHGITISAGQKESGFNFTLPVDKVILSSTLDLYINLTADMAARDSHLQVVVNGQKIGTIALNNAKLTNYQFEIPSEFLTQENSLNFEITGDDEFSCLVDYSGKYQLNIDANSYLHLNGYNLSLDPTFELFPLPFIDNFDIQKAKIHYVLPRNYDETIIKAASMLASYFGIKASTKGVKFDVSFDTLPKEHAIIFGHPEQKVAGITLPKESGIYIKTHPYFSLYKNVYVVAKNSEEFVNLIYELASSKVHQYTDKIALVKHQLPQSVAYDAPNWLPTNRKVYLYELLKKDQSLVTGGFWHSSLNLSFKAAPDLYELYEGQGDLFISYEFPLEKSIDENKSGLSVTLSGNFIDKLSMNKKGLLESIWKATGGDIRDNARHIQIPPYMIYGDNDLDLYFDLRLKQDTTCQLMQDTNLKSVIDEKSYIDFSRSVHYAKLPNLSFFAGAMFPFSRFADFSKTAILIPDSANSFELATLFDLLARSGNSTGTLVYNEEIYLGQKIFTDKDKFLNKDLLIVSTLAHQDFLNPILEDSAFFLNGNELNVFDYGIFSFRGGFFASLERFFSGDFRKANIDANRYVRTSLSWRGFLSLISPFDSDHIALIVSATDGVELSRIGDDLDNKLINAKVGGDLCLITGLDKVVSYNVGDYIYSGDVSTIFKILHFAGTHVFWLSILAFIIIVFLSYIASLHLQKRARARLNEGLDDNKL